jgi:hypothetical protein
MVGLAAPQEYALTSNQPRWAVVHRVRNYERLLRNLAVIEEGIMRLILFVTLVLAGPAFAEDLPSQRVRDQAENAKAIAVVEAATERSTQVGRRAIASMCVGCGLVAVRATQPPPPPPAPVR